METENSATPKKTIIIQKLLKDFQ